MEENKYWILDTKDLSNIKEVFSGYTIDSKGEFYLYKKPDKLDGTGCYTSIEIFQNKIIISQDFLGMQGIYHYKNENRSIFSNAYLKMVDYIINSKLNISLDKDFCVQYIFSNEEPININDTMIKEIKRLDKEISVEIDKSNGEVNLIENDWEVNAVKVDSKEAIDILDKWYNKWCIVYRNVVKMQSPILLDLSGGFDSRMCFGFFLNCNIDRNNVIIKRNLPEKNSYKKNYDDWDISQEIMDKYNFNDRCNLKYYKKKKGENLEIFEEFDNLIFGNTKNCDYAGCINSEPVFHFNGIYADRQHLGDIDEINNYLRHKKTKFAKDMKKEDIKLLADLMDKYTDIIFKKYEKKNRILFLGDFSMEYFNRFFGSKITTKIFHNEIFISPFHDPLFHKIQIHLEGTKNYYALACLIYIRYFPDLINFRFQTDSTPRKINEEEIKFAKEQCIKYPYKKIEYEYIPDLTNKNKVIYRKEFDDKNIRLELEKRLKKSEKKFVEIFGKEYFDLGFKDLSRTNIKMQNYMTPIVSICNILDKLYNN